MRSAAFAVGVFVFIAANASAGDSSSLAEKLGPVMAAEQPCSLKYDPDAIKAFIEKNVKSDDMEFAKQLDYRTWTATNSVEQMTSSSKVAFCTQEARVAKSFGFIK